MDDEDKKPFKKAKIGDNNQSKEDKISIKVFVDKVKKKVVYAEADHTFVDILFSFMTLPMGTIIKLFEKQEDKKFETFGNLNHVYKSLNDLPDCYFSTEESKFMLLNPRSVAYDHCKYLKLNIDDVDPMKYFKCAVCNDKYIDDYSTCNKAKCNVCLVNLMNREVENLDSGVTDDGGVFVSDVSTFIVTDDLSVMPYSVACSIRLLIESGIKDMNLLEERKLDMDRQQILRLLKMALSFDYPLTSLLFDANNPIIDLVIKSRKGTAYDQCYKLKAYPSSKLDIEVCLQKSTGKVLFAETNEDFIEFLFGILSLPLGTVIGTLMNGASSMGCIDNIFKSIWNMSVGGYLKSQDIKNMLLEAHFGQQYTSKNQLFTLKGTAEHTSKFISGRTHTHKDPRIQQRYLKRSWMFIVADDMVITPSSSYLTMDIMNKLKVKLDDNERHKITIGFEEGLRIVKASLQSRSSLTNFIKQQLKK